MNYGKNGTRKKRQELLKRGVRKRRVGVFFAKLFVACFLLAVAGVCCAGAYFVKGIIEEAPDISTIDATPSGYMSTVLNTDGTVTAELVASGSNRVYVTLDEVPKDLQHAFVAVEDARFYEHNGIDMQGIVRAGIKGITTGHFTEGASTLTQQLLKNNVFDGWTSETDEQRVKRKLQEQYLAVQLEKRVSKEWIMENYLNTINLGQNTLGVQAASRRYFGKDVSELNLSECAVLAAITKSPEGYNPITNPQKNQERREKVLSDMLEQEYITQEQYDEAIQDDVYDRIQKVDTEVQESKRNVTSYFVDALTDQVIVDLQEKLGYSEEQAYKALYSGGLTIYSTQDAYVQQICDEEVNLEANYSEEAKISFDYRLSIEREDGTLEHFSQQKMQQYYKEKTGDEEYSINYADEEAAQQAIDEYREAMLADGGKVIGENITFLLEPQSSVTVIDQHTGEVKALVGGRGEKTASKTLNRASDTMRQPGSTFKPLAAYAAALEEGGYTLGTTVLDEPYSYDNGKKVNNYDYKYDGWVTIRDAIRRSKNIVAVKTFTDITPELGFNYLLKFGFTTLDKVDDKGQATVLGGITNGVTNLELTGAYAAIANQGVYTEPILYTKIVDHDGNVLLENEPETHTVISETTAYLLTSAMQDVVSTGTGAVVRFQGMSIAGKTGTTSDNRDTWFAGFTPYYTCAVWGGSDDNSVLSSTRFSRTIWKGIMSRLSEGQEDVGFDMPDDIVKVTVCKASGLRPIKGVCEDTYMEYFAKGTEPKKTCDLHEEATICTESGKLAGKYCPEESKETRGFLKKSSKVSSDKDDILPTETCDIHTEESQKGLLDDLKDLIENDKKEDSDKHSDD